MTPQEQTILKHPMYKGHYSELLKQEGYIRKPHLWEINFTKVANTEVTCTYCFGARKQLNVWPNGQSVESLCAQCKGTGKMMIDHRDNPVYRRNGL